MPFDRRSHSRFPAACTGAGIGDEWCRKRMAEIAVGKDGVVRIGTRTAQAAMRHSSIDLAMNVYTDPQLLDVAGALDALPELPLADVLPNKARSATAAG